VGRLTDLLVESACIFSSVATNSHDIERHGACLRQKIEADQRHCTIRGRCCQLRLSGLCVCAKGEVVAAEADGCRCQLSAWTKIDLILSTFLTSTCANLTRQFLCHQEHVFPRVLFRSAHQLLHSPIILFINIFLKELIYI
jgi:hypothetical protein